MVPSLGGGEFYTLRLAQNLIQQGFEVKLFTSDRYLLRLFEKAGLPRKRMFLGWEPTAAWSLALWPITYLIARATFKNLLKELPRGSVLCMQGLTEKLIPTPSVTHKIFWLEHKIPGQWLKLNPLKYHYLKLVRHVKIITVSSFAKQEFVKFGVKDSNIQIIYPSIHTNSSLPVHRPINRQTTFNIGVLSRLDPEKGVLDFIKTAVPELSKRPDWKVLIAGEGPESIKIRQIIKNYNLGNQIKLLGFVSNLDLFFDQISVLAVPTRAQESFGMAAGEALLRGVWVVATKIGALLEIIEPGKNGFLIGPLAKPDLWIENLEKARNLKAVNNPVNRLFSQTFLDFLEDLSFS